METVLIEIHNSKAHKLLADLENLNITEVVNQKEQPKHKLSEKYLGSISPSTADELQDYLSQSRNEYL